MDKEVSGGCMRRTRLGVVFLLALLVALGTAGVALAHSTPSEVTVDDEGVIDSGGEAHKAHDLQHGDDEGHLPPVKHNIELIGKQAINQDNQDGRIADVNVFGDYAYLGAFYEPKCQKGGVYVMDISNPANPKQINFIRAANETYVGEGVQVIRIDTPQYKGDVLAHNNEICGKNKTGAKGGISLVDVTKPKVEKYLAEGVGDFAPAGVNGPGIAHTVHSAFAWQAGGKAYAVLVDNEEKADVDIMDISDPRSPKLIKEYDLNSDFPQIIQPDLGTSESFFHDVVVEEIDGRQVMLLSYWDGGYVTLDVTDPTNATYVGDSDFKNPDPEAAESGLTVKPEGNAHQAEFSENQDFIVAADEDFSPYSVVSRNTTEGTEFEATQGVGTPHVEPGQPPEGQTKFVGRARPGDPAVPAGDGTQIAVVERGVCTFTEKVAAVEAAGGYVGVIVFNREEADACSDLLLMSVEGNIPALFVGRDTGYSFFGVTYDEQACRSGSSQAPIPLGTTGDSVRVEAVFDGWGYVHLFTNNAGKLQELDTYALPEAHDEAYAEGFGDLSVHEVAMSEDRNDLAYFSYYSGGFRVAEIQNDELVEVGSFIDQGGNNFWGVQVWHKDGQEYVLASDRDYGLYIFKYTGN
jgi:hypothetical protein